MSYDWTFCGMTMAEIMAARKYMDENDLRFCAKCHKVTLRDYAAEGDVQCEACRVQPQEFTLSYTPVEWETWATSTQRKHASSFKATVWQKELPSPEFVEGFVSNIAEDGVRTYRVQVQKKVQQSNECVLRCIYTVRLRYLPPLGLKNRKRVWEVAKSDWMSVI